MALSAGAAGLPADVILCVLNQLVNCAFVVTSAKVARAWRYAAQSHRLYAYRLELQRAPTTGWQAWRDKLLTAPMPLELTLELNFICLSKQMLLAALCRDVARQMELVNRLKVEVSSSYDLHVFLAAIQDTPAPRLNAFSATTKLQHEWLDALDLRAIPKISCSYLSNRAVARLLLDGIEQRNLSLIIEQFQNSFLTMDILEANSSAKASDRVRRIRSARQSMNDLRFDLIWQHVQLEALTTLKLSQTVVSIVLQSLPSFCLPNVLHLRVECPNIYPEKFFRRQCDECEALAD